MICYDQKKTLFGKKHVQFIFFPGFQTGCIENNK